MFSPKRPKIDIARNEQGFASMVIGLVLIVVLGLMTIGFAELARHEQQQALNSQLSTQAFYSAETGINDVKNALSDAVKRADLATLAAASPGKCLNAASLSAITGTDNTIGDPANGFSYSCVKLKLETNEITFNGVAPDKGRSILTDTNPSSLSSLTFAWDPDAADDGKKTVRASGLDTYTDKTSWTSPAVIQLSITPLGAGYNRASLIANTYTVYLYPNNTVTAAAYSAGGVQSASGRCKLVSPIVPDYECSTRIDMSGAAAGPYLIHFLNMYTTSAVKITGNDGATVFSGGQAMIDVTGKAKNVLKRLQVRVPITDDFDVSNFAIEAQDICKRMTTQPSSTDFWNPNNSQANSGDACYPY